MNIPRSVIPLFIILIYCFSAISQPNRDIDSLKNLIRSGDLHEQQVLEIRTNIAHQYIYSSDLDSAIFYVNSVIDASTTVDLPEDYYLHYLVKAWTCQANNQNECARRFFFLARDIVSRSQDAHGLNTIELNLGSLLVQSKDSIALEFAFKIIESTDTTNPEHFQRWILANQYVAQAYANQFKYESAIQQLLQLIDDPILNKVSKYRSGLFNILSDFLKHIKDEENAKIMMRKAIALPSEYTHDKHQLFNNMAELFIGNNSDSIRRYALKVINDKSAIPHNLEISHSLLARMEVADSHYTAGLEHLNDALHYSEKMGNEEIHHQNHLLLAHILIKQEKYDDASDIIENVGSFLDADSKYENTEIKEAWTFLNTLLAYSKDAKAGTKSFLDYVKIVKNRQQLVSDAQLKELVIKHEVDKMNFLADSLALENELKIHRIVQRNRLIFIILGGVTLLVVLLYLGRRQRIRLLSDKADLDQKNEELSSELDSLNTKPSLILSKSWTISPPNKNKRIVAFGDIIMISTDLDTRNYIVYYLDTKEGVEEVREKRALSSLAKDENWPDLIFAQVHRSFVVNMYCVQEFSKSNKEIKLKKDLQCDVSKQKVTKIERRLEQRVWD